MSPSLSELKVTPSFCFAFKIPDDRAVTNNYVFTSKFLILIADLNYKIKVRSYKTVIFFVVNECTAYLPSCNVGNYPKSTRLRMYMCLHDLFT